MKNKALYTGIALVVIGLLARLYALQTEYVSEDGMLHESAWLPIGTLLLLIGIVVLIVAGVRYVVNRLRNR